MCGICGIFHLDGRPARERDAADVRRMTVAMRHRGPDHQGRHRDGPVALGAARLAIIDRTDAANQPFVSPDGEFAVVFNGEIYNYLELRAGLENEGERFRTRSDTEVLLALYRRKGASCLDDLRGMFAFAVWDRARRTLFLARDRVGEKPLAYCLDRGTFLFCSEIAPLADLPRVPRRPDLVGLHYGLYYVSIPAPYTAFRDIRKLPAASYLFVSAEGVRSARYWTPRFRPEKGLGDPREAAGELNRCLDETVGIMSRSDAPLGATLSGGLDSGAVAAALARDRAFLPTFCISHRRDRADKEFRAAALVAERLGTRHHEIAVTPDATPSLERIARTYGEPIGTPVALHAELLAKAIKPHVTVALTGSGGDELFGGYSDHIALHEMDLRGRAPRDGATFPRMRLSGIADFCRDFYSPRMKELAAAHPPEELCRDAFEESGAESLFDGFLVQQLMRMSQHSIVDIPDISGMAHSVEYRSPFLDYKMIELAMRIPPALKVRPEGGDSGGKAILRQALRDRLPEATLSLPKSGFGSALPYPDWFWGDWHETVARHLRSPLLAELDLIDPVRTEVVLMMGRRGPRPPMEPMFGLVMIAAWLEVFFGEGKRKRGSGRTGYRSSIDPARYPPRSTET